jgi:hypothetical protein
MTQKPLTILKKATNKVLELDILDISDTLTTLALQHRVKDRHIENDNILATFNQCENKIQSTHRALD